MCLASNSRAGKLDAPYWKGGEEEALMFGIQQSLRLCADGSGHLTHGNKSESKNEDFLLLPELKAVAFFGLGF
ncbi:hypothetical protein EYF80_023759 [Liparis tanakae]|uniref:Uncharacterized protein n=1 Tax=Liparis tanakae TaxID=230148 RepID=A0A4Z2HLY2_9TELE|nr:hypothetical protein EYF80_023759 [Liparis tanakae]